MAEVGEEVNDEVDETELERLLAAGCPSVARKKSAGTSAPVSRMSSSACPALRQNV